MRTLTPRHLSEIAGFSVCACPISQPNMEKARGYLTELLNALVESVELNLRLLPVEEYKQRARGSEIEMDTVSSTIKKQQGLLAAIHDGRAR